MKIQEQTGVGPMVTNGAASTIAATEPYIASVSITGIADILFHRWNVEKIREGGTGGGKGSKSKKTDDIESYVYRDSDGVICVPGEYLRSAIIQAARFRQDPRSPRKSAMDLFKAGVLSMTPLAPLGTEKWDYEHASRAMVQRQGVTRIRPALRAGWNVSFEFVVMLPEYIEPSVLLEVIANAGRLVGIGDFRPTYGRFQVVRFEVLSKA